ncbi:1-phosphofructokinase family hexose kinase [Actinoplanes palleronii]|uniref:Sugar kinase n=1 Tax=Actinoplanes palleronii TaxID=113570 RepID=A0ABQ4BG33_9ACTN|nr:hexose kinase [Actinoplanes palleronii]GIE69634.1 sugar kinase [Actinoplanes palleronii]
MIVTVTLNPALDLTYPVGALVPHRTHRVTGVAERAGGKGLNVARVLHALGEPVLATGLLGGPSGAVVASLLATEGVPASFVPIAGDTRRTVAVVDPGGATGFWEPGPVVPAAEWLRFVDHFRELVGRAAVVTLCGSLPPGLPIDAYAVLSRLAAAEHVPVLLDTSGPALRHGLAAAPTVAKPNAEELAELGTVSLEGGALVVSHGPEGLHAITPDGEFRCAPPYPVDGNPTGAGDACAAALARGLRDGAGWPELLADAVALGAAAVASPVAGSFDPDVYRSTRAALAVTSGGGSC